MYLANSTVKLDYLEAGDAQVIASAGVSKQRLPSDGVDANCEGGGDGGVLHAAVALLPAEADVVLLAAEVVGGGGRGPARARLAVTKVVNIPRCSGEVLQAATRGAQHVGALDLCDLDAELARGRGVGGAQHCGDGVAVAIRVNEHVLPCQCPAQHWRVRPSRAEQ